MRERGLFLLLLLSLFSVSLSGSPSSQQSLSPSSADGWVSPTLVSGLSRSGADSDDKSEGLDHHFDAMTLEDQHDEAYAEASLNFQNVVSSIANSEQQLTVPNAAPAAADPSAVTSAQGPTGVATRARVDFFVMSRCPDSRRCANEFAPAIKKLHSLKAVDVHVNYIASVQNGRPRCMHGDQECVDNLYQICARELYSGSKQNLEWFDFMLCSMNSRNAQACAQQYKLDFRAIQACASSQQGASSFVRSIRATRDSGVDTSCTISVDKQRFCVHNGGWQNCNYGSTSQAMVNYICKKHPGTCLQS